MFHQIISPLLLTTAAALTAQPAHAASAAPTHILFFGGYGSTTAQTKSWATSASAAISHAGENFDVQAFPINSSHSDKTNVVADNAKAIAAWATKISQNPNENYLLVGHSSGTAISNAIALQVKTRSVPLIVLDGFIPSSSLQANAECWSSVDATDSRKTSLNTSSMRSCKFYREIKVQGCTSSMCLHFALVNSNAPAAGISSSTYKTQGYAKLIPFLGWL